MTAARYLSRHASFSNPQIFFMPDIFSWSTNNFDSPSLAPFDRNDDYIYPTYQELRAPHNGVRRSV